MGFVEDACPTEATARWRGAGGAETRRRERADQAYSLGELFYDALINAAPPAVLCITALLRTAEISNPVIPPGIAVFGPIRPVAERPSSPAQFPRADRSLGQLHTDTTDDNSARDHQKDRHLTPGTSDGHIVRRVS